MSTLRNANQGPAPGATGPPHLFLSALPGRTGKKGASDSDEMFVIDQDQARKFWTGWVRREIGGSEMIQEAAVSAAINELLLGHDNQAAGDAARTTAHQLAGGIPPVGATLPASTPASTAAATPTAARSPLNPAKPLFRRPWRAAAAGVAVAAIIA